MLLGGVAIGACGGGKDTASSNQGSGTASTGSGSTSSGTSSGPGSGGATSGTASSGSGSTSSSGGAGTGGTAPQTVSSWMGTNINADLPRVDVTYQLAPFDTPAAMKDANGYPVAGVAGTSSTDIGFVLPTGTYNVSFKGGGTLTVSGIGKLMGSWTTANGEQRNQIAITGTPGSFGNFLTLTIAATPGQTVTDLHVYMPGVDYDTTDTFTPQFLALLAPFRAMRFMEWLNINNSTLANWSDRPTSSTYGQSTYGQPYEHIAELVNETGKDCWINVPELATDDFITQYATFFAQSLDFTRIDAARAKMGLTTPFQLIVENSNETWNQGFSAYKTFLAAANMDTSRYTGTYTGSYGPSWMTGNSDLVKVGQYEADRLVKIATAFRTAFTAVGKASVVQPVLSGWALGAGYSDVGLTFIQANYGAPKDNVSYIALAPYFSPPDDTTTGALDTLFTACTTAISGMDSTFQDFAKLAAADGIQVAAYEGGQGISGATNQPIKHLAQHDERMYETYLTYFTLWKKDFGESLFMHFDLAGDPGLPENIYQYGFWGSIIGVMEDTSTCEPNLPTLTGTESIASVVHHCPKYRALAEQAPQ
jgi:hypothetical protein